MSDKQNQRFSVSNRSSKPVVGIIDPVLSKSFESRPHGLQQCSTVAHLNKEKKLYRYRFSKEHVYLPEVLQHEFYENAEQITSNYPDVINAIMVIGSIASNLSIVVAIVLHYGFRQVLNVDMSNLKKDCQVCWKHMSYKSGSSLDDDFTPFEQMMVPLVSSCVGIGCAVILRFVMKPFVRRYGKSTAAAGAIVWYLVMGIGEIVLFNMMVEWKTPVQKIGVNVFWFIFDGPYIVYLGSKLIQGKLRLKQNIPVYFFYSTVICVTILTCFSSCLILKRINAI